MNLRARLAARAAAWARRRQGTDPLPLVLKSRRLYIVPTRAGLGAAVLLFVMLVAGLNYTNSLALLLTFTLTGYVLVGMHECHRSLLGLELTYAQPADCYAGEAGVLELRFANAGSTVRRALVASCPGREPVHFELDPGAHDTVRLSFHAARRGRLPLEPVQLASTAPGGLFRAWTWLHLPSAAIVYPRPEGRLPLPRSARATGTALATAGTDEEQWSSLRSYQPGDSTRSIAWKAYARGAPLMVSQYDGTGGSEYQLSFAGLESLDLEARLSQLTAWSDECARLGAASALRLPGCVVPLGQGPEHRTQLLRALALYGEATS